MDGWMDGGMDGFSLTKRISKCLCSRACTVELHFQPFHLTLTKNTLRKSCAMMGWMMRQEQTRMITCVSCITAMYELKALLAVAMMVSGEPTC